MNLVCNQGGQKARRLLDKWGDRKVQIKKLWVVRVEREPADRNLNIRSLCGFLSRRKSRISKEDHKLED